MRPSLTAASQPIDDPQKSFKSTMGGGNNGWQEAAWDMLDLVGELRYYVGWRASSCSRVRMVASDIDDETGLPTGSTENRRVQEIVKAIAGGALGQGQLIKRMVECLTVPGETWVVIIHPPEGEEWLSLSRDEIKVRQGRTFIERPTGDEYELRKPADSMFRVWNPKPRRAKQPDSPVRATLDPLHEIVRTTKTISNASKSRLIGNGVVFVPQEMSLPSQNQLTPTTAGVALDPGEVAPEFNGASAVGQLQELLFQVASTAYDDEDSLAALIPMFAAVPGDQVKNVSHLKFDNSVTEIAIKTRADAIARLAMGLDVTPERLLGLGSNSNHWSAWQIGDDDVRLHIAPPMEVICQAIYAQAVTPVLISEGIDPSKYMLWYDPSVLTADPDLTDEATAAFDRGAITAEAYRDFLGLGATGYDFTKLDGWQQWATDQIAKDAALLPSLAPLLQQQEVIDLAPSTPAVAPPPPEDDPEEPTDDQSEPDTEGDEPPPADSARSDTAETAVVEVMVSRALELAGKRRRTRADHNRLRGVPMHETHRYMPPVPDREIDDLVKGWDTTLAEDTLRRMGLNPDRVRVAVRRQVREEMSRQVVDSVVD
ncbi:portal protein [Gordonia phage Mariokart]|nr:portal protein [Gordonia phage Mariokart]